MSANLPDPQRILSVQSHVVSGYVGNRSATFPLQLLGWDVDVANTVQFSNHTGYGRWQGIRFDASHLQQLFDGLEQNGLLRYSRMLTGYMPSAQVVSTVLDLVKKLRSGHGHDDDLIYLLDPVMGDIGRGMYVSPQVVPIYKQMLPFSTIITPNQFEAQILSDIEIHNLDSLRSVLYTLHHQYKVAHIIITSFELPREDLVKIGALSDHLVSNGGSKTMLQVGSSCPIIHDENGERKASITSKDQLEIWMIQFPEVQGYFSGVGDTFAALTLGRFQPDNQSIPVQGLTKENSTDTAPLSKPLTPIAKASELAIASLQGILSNTCQVIEKVELEQQQQHLKTDSELSEQEKRVENMRKRELCIIQSKNQIESPTVIYRAKWIQQ